MKYVLCFGNPYIGGDDLVVNLVKDFKVEGYEFVCCRGPEEILNYADKDFVLLDVAKGISEITLIDDVNKLNFKNMISLHDFDLNFFLKLYDTLGKKVRIIAVPMGYSVDKLKKEIKKFL